MESQKDLGLKIRMTGLIVSLGLLYVLFITALSVFFQNSLFIIFATIMALTLAWSGPNIALRATGARKVSPDEYPELHNRVSRLSHQAEMPKPDVAVSSTKAPNAFASGRSKNSAVICITEGLLESLDGDELDAVIAHELSHVRNKDMSIMMIASSLAAVAHFIVRWGWLADGGAEPGQGGGGILVAILISFVVWIASFFMLRILSRYREFTADRGAVAITGKPMALVSALETIEGVAQETPNKDLRDVTGTKAMNFYELEADYMSKLLNTHPEPEKRIDKLEDMQKEIN